MTRRIAIPIIVLAALAACSTADFKPGTGKGPSDQAGSDDCFEDCAGLPNVTPTDSGGESGLDAADG